MRAISKTACGNWRKVRLRAAKIRRLSVRIGLRGVTRPCADASGGGVLSGLPGRAEGGDFAGLAQHLVDFARVKLVGIDHLPGVFLDDDRPPFGAFQQLAIKGERLGLGFERLAHHRIDIGLMALSRSGPIASDGYSPSSVIISPACWAWVSDSAACSRGHDTIGIQLCPKTRNDLSV